MLKAVSRGVKQNKYSLSSFFQKSSLSCMVSLNWSLLAESKPVCSMKRAEGKKS